MSLVTILHYICKISKKSGAPAKGGPGFYYSGKPAKRRPAGHRSASGGTGFARPGGSAAAPAGRPLLFENLTPGHGSPGWQHPLPPRWWYIRWKSAPSLPDRSPASYVLRAVELVAAAKEQGNAPDRGQTDECVDHARSHGGLPAADPRHEIKPEQADAAPVHFVVLTRIIMVQRIQVRRERCFCAIR